jgi:hypothetical protein
MPRVQRQLAPAPARRRLRIVVAAAGALVLLLCIGAVALVHGTRYDTQSLAQLPAVRERGAPAWSRPCWRPNRPPYDGFYTLPCARVEGRVVYRQGRDPDGDGDAHLLVVAGSHLVNLKFRFAGGGAGLPGLGHRVRVVGLLGSGRLDVPEVDVRRIG